MARPSPECWEAERALSLRQNGWVIWERSSVWRDGAGLRTEKVVGVMVMVMREPWGL